MKLEKKYNYLNTVPGQPWLIREALKEYGTKEIVGPKHNKSIMEWADEIGGWEGTYYDKDEIPWCGLFVAIICKRAKKDIAKGFLGAKNWNKWGNEVNVGEEGLGDVLVFSRNGGGHVGFYVAEDTTHYHVLGGNQSNSVNITRIDKTRLFGIRRAEYNIQPTGVIKVILDADGIISTNES
jgi:uncharacterized protein (TIGR02594 family)